MAVRTTSTRLAVEGDAAYTAAIKNCNAQLSLMKSELQALESEFKENANSLEALQKKQDALTKTEAENNNKLTTLKSALAEAKTAQESYSQSMEKTKEKISATERELAGLSGNYKAVTEQKKKLKDELTKLNKELALTTAKEKAAGDGVTKWQKSINLTNRDLSNLKRELKQNNTYLDEAKKSANGAATSIDQYGNAVDNTQKGLDRLKNKATLLALIAAIIAFIYQILGMFGVVAPISEELATHTVGMLVNLLVGIGVVVDPTTTGIIDSDRALTYQEPK